MKAEEMVFVGIKRQVLALDRNTGKVVWETELKIRGGYFVNVFVDRGNVIAAAAGQLFCLDAANGRIKWENPLKGYGRGMITLASVAGASANSAGLAGQMAENAVAADAAAAVVGTTAACT